MPGRVSFFVCLFVYLSVCRSVCPIRLLKVIYHPLYNMNIDVLIWGDWLSCDSLRGSHDN